MSNRMVIDNAMPAFRSFSLALLLTIVSGSALAEPQRWHDQRRDDRAQHEDNGRRPMRDVIGEVEHNYRGHVVDVQPPGANEGMYRVRVLQEGGRVKTLRVPAERERDRRHE